MNISTSECSSGCESGWTMYFDQISTDQCNRNSMHNDYQSKGGGEEEVYEDLSMLSDASSGPPHFHREQELEEEEECSEDQTAESKKNKNNTKKSKEQKKMQQNFHLDDDTASSPPVFTFSKASHKSNFHQNNAVLENDKSLKEHDSGSSATHYKGKSVVLKKHFGFFKNSRPGKAD